MNHNLHQPARLQYWSSGRHARPEDAIDFRTLQDAIAFAMTQRPGNKDIAWILTEDGTTLLPSRIVALWEIQRTAA